jgi:hypothetical protein
VTNTWENNLNEGKLILAHCFNPWLSGPIAVSLRQSWTSWWGTHDKSKMHTSLQQRSSTNNRKGLGTRYVFPGHIHSNPLPPISTCFPQFYHLPIVYSYFESISRSVHWWRQNPHDPITSQSNWELLWMLLKMGTKQSMHEPLGEMLYIPTITNTWFFVTCS